MRSNRIPVAIALCALLSTSLSCGDDDNGSTGPPAPVPGTLILTLDTPYADDGAVLLRLEGPNITQVELAAPGLYLRFLEDQAGLTAVFVGNVSAGDLLSFRVPECESRRFLWWCGSRGSGSFEHNASVARGVYADGGSVRP